MQVGHAITTASHGSLGGISIVPVPTGKQIAYLRHSQIIVFLHRYAALPYHLACIIQAHGPQTETKFGITTQLFVKPRLCLGRTECSAKAYITPSSCKIAANGRRSDGDISLTISLAVDNTNLSITL